MSTERNHPKNVDHDNCYCQSEYYVKYEPNRTNSFKESLRHPPNIDNMSEEQIDRLHNALKIGCLYCHNNKEHPYTFLNARERGNSNQ